MSKPSTPPTSATAISAGLFDHMQAIEHANAALARPLPVKAHGWYPGYHLAPPSGWMNDPNGVIYFDGYYHVFYQHDPFGPTQGRMHWGHARSLDLIHWEHLPVALAPGDSFDLDGCFSGCAVDDNGVLTLLYTGHVWLGAPGDERHIHEVQCLATSQDGIHFTKYGVVLDTPPAPGVSHFRDPRVWREGDQWYMVVGFRTDDDTGAGIGKVALYRGDTLYDWTLLGTLDGESAQEAPGKRAYMWECPDFFALDDQQVLMYSPQGLKPQGFEYWNLFQNGCVIGCWMHERFTPESGFATLDHGHDFYAAQRLEAPDGRQLLIAWCDMWESKKPSQKDEWAGMMTLPRELFIADGKVRMRPARELETLRQPGITHKLLSVINSEHPLALPTLLQEVQLHLDLTGSTAAQFGLNLRCSEDGREVTRLYVDAMAGRLVLDRNAAGAGPKGVRSIALPPGDILHLRLYLDRSSLEVFVGDEHQSFRETLSSRIFPHSTSCGASLFAIEGEMRIVSLESWSLKETLGYPLSDQDATTPA